MVHTHEVTITGDVVRKCYVSWDEGEPEREWAALELLARHAPGLAPTPIGRESQDGRPVVVMSLLPGKPLTGDLTSAQQNALVHALRRLFAVPVPTQLEERANGPEAMRDIVLEWMAKDHDLSACLDRELVSTAKARAVEWLETVQLPVMVDRVIALGDGNLDNVLWDGETCRLIDWEEYGASELAYEIADLVEHSSSRLTGSLDVDDLLVRFDLTGRANREGRGAPAAAGVLLAGDAAPRKPRLSPQSAGVDGGPGAARAGVAQLSPWFRHVRPRAASLLNQWRAGCRSSGSCGPSRR